MELNDEFEVPLPLEEVWAVFTDFAKLASLVPGAELREVDGEECKGILKVRVGPVSVSYRGTARLESLDADAHAAVLKAEGRQIRGQGTGTSLVTVTMSSFDNGTRVKLATDVSITGKLAQFDRDEVAEASARLVADFARSLESYMTSPVEEPVEGTGASEESAEASSEKIIQMPSGEEAESAEMGSAQIYPTSTEPDAKPESLIRRLTPYLTVAGVLLILRIVVYSLRRRRR